MNNYIWLSPVVVLDSKALGGKTLSVAEMETLHILIYSCTKSLGGITLTVHNLMSPLGTLHPSQDDLHDLQVSLLLCCVKSVMAPSKVTLLARCILCIWNKAGAA
jgi:hypothetical protein